MGANRREAPIVAGLADHAAVGIAGGPNQYIALAVEAVDIPQSSVWAVDRFGVAGIGGDVEIISIGEDRLENGHGLFDGAALRIASEGPLRLRLDGLCQAPGSQVDADHD